VCQLQYWDGEPISPRDSPLGVPKRTNWANRSERKQYVSEHEMEKTGMILLTWQGEPFILLEKNQGQ